MIPAAMGRLFTILIRVVDLHQMQLLTTAQRVKQPGKLKIRANIRLQAQYPLIESGSELQIPDNDRNMMQTHNHFRPPLQ